MVENSEQWLLSTLYKANRNDVDTYRLYLTMRRYIYDTRDFTGFIEEIIPGQLRFKPVTDVADDCFFSVSMFSKYLDKRASRRGAPNATFYSRLGRKAFKTIGYPGISRNWRFWIAFVQEHVVL